MASLVDVSVLLALMHERHVFTSAAVDWLERREKAEAVAVCRVAQMGVLRILTRPSIMREDVLSAAECWDGWARLLEDDRFVFVPEPSGLEAVWQRLTAGLPKGQCAETDSCLAAFALSGGYRLASFDKGFNRFPKLDLELLAPAGASRRGRA